MTANEAYILVSERAPNREAVRCIEYDNYFIFATVPKNIREFHGFQFDSSYAVNKENSKICVYSPLNVITKGEQRIVEVFK